MKRLILLTVIAATVLSLGTSAMAQDVKTVTVGLSWNQYDVGLVKAWETYMQAEGEKQGPAAGIKFQWVITGANGDPAQQAANIEDMINQGVNIIIARAQDSAAIGASIRAAKDANIPFVTFDRASKTTPPTAHVGGDSYAQGLSTAEAFAEILTKSGVKGKCIEMQGQLVDENAVNRSKAWNAVDAKSDAFETIVQVPTDWDATKFLSGTANAVAAHPEANCMFLASDFAITSVQSALEGAGKWAPTGQPNHMWMATQDLFPEAYTAMKAGYIDVTTTYDAFQHAQEAVRVMIAIVNGVDPKCGPNGCLVAGRVATPANVDTLENLWSKEFGQPVPAATATAEATQSS